VQISHAPQTFCSTVLATGFGLKIPTRLLYALTSPEIIQDASHDNHYGTTHVNSGSAKAIDINHYRWQKHCHGLLQLPMAA
jgi:hypothetical protein